ncbi:MAG: DUF4154 domain-containing protein [Blastocatellia bacterium AA13]|nr:MAG: DUF4154 domain-containing protein [Blastocatellia bacterium AA13]
MTEPNHNESVPTTRSAICRLSASSARIRRRAIAALALGCIVGSHSFHTFGGQGADEYQVKAAFLYNFAKFVEWPSEAFGSDGRELTIGLITDETLGKAIEETINGKTANGRTIVVRHFKPGDNPGACQMLFVGSTEHSRLNQILDKLRGSSVLVVGELPRFNQRGGMINFVMDGSKVRFEINQNAAEAARLKISSKLLQLAKPSGR